MMSENRHLDDMRRQALDKMEQSQKAARLFVVFAALVEAGLLITFLVVMDFHERLHWLLLIAACLVYGTLGFGLLTLGAYVRHWVLRVLCAVEQLQAEEH